METKVTSKTSSLQALLLRAWRERWSDLQWGIQIKTILPRGVSGDVHNLADCILQQALVGPGPNQLVLSYLKHSLSSQLVSYAAVLQRISKYDGVHKPHCIISLLEFVEGILGRMTCRSRAEESALATAVLSLVNWLLTIALHALHKLDELCTSPEHATMLLRPTALLSTLLSCDFAKAMLCLARLDDKDLHSEVVRKCLELETALSQPLNFKIGLNIEDTLRTLSHLRNLGPPGAITGLTAEDDMICEPVTYCLQPLLAVEVLLNPSADTQIFVNQILMVQRIKGYSMARLYAEVMRACLISLKDVLGGNEQSHWGAFTFLKVPHILLQLHHQVRGSSQGTPEQPDFSQDIVDAIELLMQHTPLLDTVDVKCSCSCIECLLTEFARVGLISEHLVKIYSARRESAVAAVQKLDLVAQSAAVPKVIVRAEPTLARILKTLDSDYLKIQDALLSVLSQVLTGKSFELILAVATVQGKLRTFVAKLINFNECSRKPAADEATGGKGSLTRAMLFDVSFLMLCSIVQTYGSDVVLNEDGGTGDSFFEQWVRECMAERGHPKSPDIMLRGCDPAKLEALLAQFISPEMEFKTSQVRWHEVCRHVPAATRELLFAWEQGALSPTDVKRALDSMRSRMGCLPVCAAAWLCSYMQILDQDALLKPMNMVQQFLTPTDDMPQQDNYKERSSLTFQIIRKMQYDLFPPSMSKAKLSHNIVSASPISEQLASVWSGAHQRGWINIEATHVLESLLHTGGAQWFVSNVIKEVLTYRYRDDLDKAVDLAFALFHLDIEQCTLSLLQHLLPLYLHNQLQGEDLVEPQASALAKLSSYCVFAALESPHASPTGSSRARKRTRLEVDTEASMLQDLERMLPGPKVLRLRSTDSQDGGLMFEGGMSSSASCGSAVSEGTASEPVLREPLKKALTSLFQAFLVIAQDGEVSQHTHFVFKFLEFCVSCGKERARLVLQVMPGNLVPSLLSSLPDLFNTDLLLCLYDTNTSVGRKDTARDLCMLRNMSLQPPAASVRDFTGQQA